MYFVKLVLQVADENGVMFYGVKMGYSSDMWLRQAKRREYSGDVPKFLCASQLPLASVIFICATD